MVEIVQLSEGDWARYRAIQLRSLTDTPDAFWMTTADEEGQPEAFWRQRLRAVDRATFLAVDRGHDVGTLGVGPHHDAPTGENTASGPPQPRESRGGATAVPPQAALYGVWVTPRPAAAARPIR
ncbi:MAG TPA: hypothetical protein VMM13_17705 [Euzebya sp.]|nr:hypothetical protein [Euzebya sp.]